MYLHTDQENAIAQGKVLAFLLMGKNPCPLNVMFAAEKLQLEPEQISAALRALEVEGQIELVLSRAIVTLKDVPSAVSVELPPKETDAEAFTKAHLSSFDGSPESTAHLKDHPGNPQKNTGDRVGLPPEPEQGKRKVAK